jgi:hypothetical protein
MIRAAIVEEMDVARLRRRVAVLESRLWTLLDILQRPERHVPRGCDGPFWPKRGRVWSRRRSPRETKR